MDTAFTNTVSTALREAALKLITERSGFTLGPYSNRLEPRLRRWNLDIGGCLRAAAIFERWWKFRYSLCCVEPARDLVNFLLYQRWYKHTTYFPGASKSEWGPRGAAVG